MSVTCKVLLFFRYFVLYQDVDRENTINILQCMGLSDNTSDIHMCVHRHEREGVVLVLGMTGQFLN
jgi:hypothetical protein